MLQIPQYKKSIFEGKKLGHFACVCMKSVLKLKSYSCFTFPEMCDKVSMEVM